MRVAGLYLVFFEVGTDDVLFKIPATDKDEIFGMQRMICRLIYVQLGGFPKNIGAGT